MSPTTETTDAFEADAEGLQHALAVLLHGGTAQTNALLPDQLPECGLGAVPAINELAHLVLGEARNLGSPGFLAHMDPPTPWITWAMHLWTASRNQNLLHPDTAPKARELEARVVDWLAPVFSMSGGHMTPGSTIANLTAIWAARQAGAHTVVATVNAHLSIAKAAHLLAMTFRPIDDWAQAGDLDGCVAVITAGTTSTGSIEPLDAGEGAAWRHVDAAWAAPLMLSERHRHLLAGIESADSISVSAHKWLFQPKESALVLFADVAAAHQSVSFGADYLAVPNVGVLGSHGAAAVPLLATLLAYGRQGLASWIDQSMTHIDELAELVQANPLLVARTPPNAGVLNWRHIHVEPRLAQERLPGDVFVSTTMIHGESWLRSVGANPMANAAAVIEAVLATNT